MSRVQILSDDDADGLMSARLVNLAHDIINVPCSVTFQDWYQFGVTQRNIKDIEEQAKLGYTDIYILDIGSDEEILASLEMMKGELFEQNIFVKLTLLDNHPPENFQEMVKKFQSREFRILSSNETCTAGLCYEMFEDVYALDEKAKRWAEIWTLLGLHGDVANKYGAGKELFDRLLEKHPELVGNRLYPKLLGEEWVQEPREIIGNIAKYFHNAKRMAYGAGTVCAYDAMKILEEKDDIFYLEHPPNPTLGDADLEMSPSKANNALEKLRAWTYQWDSDKNGWKLVLKTRNSITIEYPKFVATIINHPWNLGSALCNVKADDFAKTQIAINIGVPEMIVVSARNPSDESEALQAKKRKPKAVTRLHIGKFLENASKYSNGRMNGGGLGMAGSGNVQLGTPTGQILNWLAKASEETEEVSYMHLVEEDDE